jgi:hypothetical protein
VHVHVHVYADAEADARVPINSNYNQHHFLNRIHVQRMIIVFVCRVLAHGTMNVITFQLKSKLFHRVRAGMEGMAATAVVVVAAAVGGGSGGGGSGEVVVMVVVAVMLLLLVTYYLTQRHSNKLLQTRSNYSQFNKSGKNVSTYSHTHKHTHSARATPPAISLPSSPRRLSFFVFLFLGILFYRLSYT